MKVLCRHVLIAVVSLGLQARAADTDMALLRREEIGIVTQFLRPRPRVSALELVAEPLLAAGTGWDEAIEQAKQMLHDFGLKEDLWNAYPTTFSGGEQQKVNLARALIRPFRLLLLDEPTASLDSSARASLVQWIGQLKQRGTALIGIFHHPEDVQQLIDGEVHLNAPNGLALPNDIDLDDIEESYVAQ